ncbi:YbbR-like domain-containing protein [Algoriphagus lacus]|uniref:YbbR-like domain-containing protein n=1 Tax=Algoriphagus lacus TaxID=2056311 RepID=A0A418PSY7_9BACT|nr:YbbR-like domain-containing protein [Algoriphagus lacus]RIW16204.1 YbbR-like domain-containing protein [Algoriphagus lacus]
MPDTKKSSRRISSKRLSNLKVVVLCIAAATTFWILNALNKDNYTTIVDYPITWEYNQEDYVAVKPLPKSVQIQISGNGWDLLRKYFKLNEPPFVIYLAEPAAKNFILTSDLKRPLGEFITPTLLEGLLEDSISYQIDKIETRKVKPVLDSAGYSLAKNTEIEGEIDFSPKQITITGPTSLLDLYNDGFPVLLNENRIDENFSSSVNLSVGENLEPLIQLQEKSVQVSFSVVKFLQGNKRLKVKKINFPRTVTLENEEITPMITYLVDERKVAELKDMEFEAILDYGKRNREDSTLAIVVKPNPKYIKEIKVEPALVKLKYE